MRSVDAKSHVALALHAARILKKRGQFTHGEILGSIFLGISRAAEKYDPELGVKFGSYAWRWIRKSMRDYRDAELQWIRFPKNVTQEIDLAVKVQRDLSHATGRNPSDDEIMNGMGIGDGSRDRVLSAWRIFTDTRDADSTLLRNDRTIGPDRLAAGREESRMAVEALSCLSPKERRAIELYFGLDDGGEMLLTEVAEAEGYTHQRAQFLVKSGLGKLRKILESKGIKE